MASLMSIYWLEILHLSTYVKERYFASHCLLINDSDLGPAVPFPDLVAWAQINSIYWVFNLFIFCVRDWWVKALQLKICVQFSSFTDSSYFSPKKCSNDSTLPWNILFCWNRMEEQYWSRALKGVGQTFTPLPFQMRSKPTPLTFG